MMSERFATFAFTVPLPFGTRDKAFPKCGRCAAAFFLRGKGPPQQAAEAFFGTAAPGTGVEVPAPMAAPGQAAAPPSGQCGPGFVDALRHLCQLHRSGDIDAEEFLVAKRRLLGQ